MQMDSDAVAPWRRGQPPGRRCAASPWLESLLNAALSRLAAAGEAVTANLAHAPGYATPALHTTG